MPSNVLANQIATSYCPKSLFLKQKCRNADAMSVFCPSPLTRLVRSRSKRFLIQSLTISLLLACALPFNGSEGRSMSSETRIAPEQSTPMPQCSENSVSVRYETKGFRIGIGRRWSKWLAL